MTPVLTSHPWREKEDEEEEEREREKGERERERNRNTALLPNTCIFNLIFEIIHINDKNKQITWLHNAK